MWIPDGARRDTDNWNRVQNTLLFKAHTHVAHRSDSIVCTVACMRGVGLLAHLQQDQGTTICGCVSLTRVPCPCVADTYARVPCPCVCRIVRMDQAHTESCDLSGIGRQFGIKVTDKISGRDYFFSAASEVERTEWVTALEKAEATT